MFRLGEEPGSRKSIPSIFLTSACTLKTPSEVLGRRYLDGATENPLLPERLPQQSVEQAHSNLGTKSARRAWLFHITPVFLVFLLSAAYMAHELKRGVDAAR